MKRSAPALALVPLLVYAAAGLAQPLPPAPQPTLAQTGACPALARFDFDVTSFPGAERIQFQMRRGQPGQDFGAATQVEAGNVQGATGSVERDLRTLGPVLDGTRYFLRIRARGAGDALSDWSEPAVFDQVLTPDGTFTAGPGSRDASLRIDWNLGGEIGACADRVAYSIDPVGAGGTVTGEGSGTSGTDAQVVGPGEHDVRLHARHGGIGPERAVGRESAPIRVTVGAPPAVLVALRVEVGDQVLDDCPGPGVAIVSGATVRVVGDSPGPDGAIFDETLASDAAGRAIFTVPAGVPYNVAASSARCAGPGSASVTPSAATTTVVRLPGCHDAGADVRVLLSAPGGVAAGAAVDLIVTLVHAGGAGPSRAGTFGVVRIGDTGRSVQIDNRALPAFCPSEERTFVVTNASPPPGRTTFRATATLADASAANNVATQVVDVAAPAAPVLVVDAFRLQGGAATVAASTPITLDATIRGVPTQFKASECGLEFTRTAFRPWPVSPPPTLPGFLPGTRIVCFQVQNRTLSSAVVRDTIQVVQPLLVGPVTGEQLSPVQLSIRSFQVQGGAPMTTEQLSMRLNFTTFGGTPTEFRSHATRTATCVEGLATQAWKPLPAGTVPTQSLGLILSLGRKFLCIQVRRGTSTSLPAADDIEIIARTSQGRFIGRGRGELSGESRTAACGGDQLAVGLRVRAAALVDAIALRCATLGPNGQHTNVTNSVEVGGTGGTPQALMCPSGQVLYGFQGRSGEFIDRIGILCTDWRADTGSDGDFSPVAAAGGTTGEPFGPFTCEGVHAVKSIRVLPIFGIAATMTFGCIAPPGI